MALDAARYFRDVATVQTNQSAALQTQADGLRIQLQLERQRGDRMQVQFEQFKASYMMGKDELLAAFNRVR